MSKSAVCVLLCCIVSAFMVGVQADCVAIAKARAEANSESASAAALSTAYSEALGELPQGACTEAQVVAVAQAKALAIAFAYVDVFAETKAAVYGDEGCVGTAEAQALALGKATAQAIAAAHAQAVAGVLVPFGAPLSIAFAQADAATTALEVIFADAYSESNVEGLGEVEDMDEDLQTAIAVALAEVFAKATATYYCGV
eukprot:TRINITY_DN257_c0_g5_i1.p1 TRINITY_DN257_c0_g5~~TRINITY_DN257_c0_g5_i1.p1  ORF type:complete len:230 (-),score=57.69 TRINITY_DN257_c0_g5_i1:970-1569(-)